MLLHNFSLAVLPCVRPTRYIVAADVIITTYHNCLSLWLMIKVSTTSFDSTLSPAVAATAAVECFNKDVRKVIY